MIGDLVKHANVLELKDARDFQLYDAELDIPSIMLMIQMAFCCQTLEK